MSRPCLPLFALAVMVAIASPAVSQTVSMSGDHGESGRRTSNFPLNPPKRPCTNVQNARCHQGSNLSAGIVDNLAVPGSGVPVAGAGVVIMAGGHHITGLNMRFAPEPTSTASLFLGLGLLAILGGQRR